MSRDGTDRPRGLLRSQKRAVVAVGRCNVRDASGSRRRVRRRVEPDDIAVFFEQQADPAAAAMAAFPARDRVAHDEHSARILGDSSCVAGAIVLPDGQIVGNPGSFDVEGERHVGYWIGREHWGQGHATRALIEFVAEFPEGSEARTRFRAKRLHRRGKRRTTGMPEEGLEPPTRGL